MDGGSNDDDVKTAEPEDGIVLHSLYLAMGMAYVFYYLFYVVKKPILACNSELSSFLERHCPIVTQKFWPTIWCIEARAQTVFRSLIQSRPAVPYERELLTLSDGGQVALDWVYNESSPHYTEHKPIVIILPGLVGSSQESYVLHLVNESVKNGLRSVVFNYRGTGGTELKTSRTYNATNTEDLSYVVSHVTKKFPDCPIMATGVSLGGIILTNYLAKTGTSCGLKACMIVSVVWNVFESAKSLEEPINLFIFNRMLCNHLKEAVIRHEHLFKDKFDLKAVYDSCTIRDFDESFTSKLFGYQSNDDYYRDACIDKKLHDIKIPLLCVNAADDPFSPGHTIPVDEAFKSSNVAIVVTPRGGHIGFLDGFIYPSACGFIQRVFAQFSNAVFTRSEEIGGCKE